MVAYRIDLGVDFRQGATGVIIQTQGSGDDGCSHQTVGRKVIDALRLGNSSFQGLGNESRHGLGIGPIVTGGNSDHRILGLRILAHRQPEQRPQPQHQDDQVDHRGQYRSAQEEIRKTHGIPLLFLRGRRRRKGRCSRRTERDGHA
ncbi:hypothetical protein FEMY_12500 [Ferrovum myxofaciens]|uniref:Uncharacterized protein n=1 Tax=Ferrovum myxofaciens TaxID=416213 RepID=A0A149VY82_9PROT|nr:hypothetical protein FEMY_12500 [Ferrovum myxofaciens]